MEPTRENRAGSCINKRIKSQLGILGNLYSGSSKRFAIGFPSILPNPPWVTSREGEKGAALDIGHEGPSSGKNPAKGKCAKDPLEQVLEKEGGGNPSGGINDTVIYPVAAKLTFFKNISVMEEIFLLYSKFETYKLMEKSPVRIILMPEMGFSPISILSPRPLGQ